MGYNILLQIIDQVVYFNKFLYVLYQLLAGAKGLLSIPTYTTMEERNNPTSSNYDVIFGERTVRLHIDIKSETLDLEATSGQDVIGYGCTETVVDQTIRLNKAINELQIEGAKAIYRGYKTVLEDIKNGLIDPNIPQQVKAFANNVKACIDAEKDINEYEGNNSSNEAKFEDVK